MAEITALPTDDQAGEDVGPAFVGRVGIAMAAIGEHADGAAQASIRRLCAALERDARVPVLRVPSADSYGIRMVRSAAEGSPRANDYAPAEPNEHIHVVMGALPVVFQVRVPKRLQVPAGEPDDAPSDEYWVAWDGMSLLILWTFEDFRDSLAPVGGQIVLEVLRDASTVAGVELRTPPCGPNCDYPFAHADLLIESGDPHEDTFEFHGFDASAISAIVTGPETSDIEDCTRQLFEQVSFLAWSFAEMREIGQGVVSAERSARGALSRLLAVNYERTRVIALPLWARLVGRWQGRGWRREADRLIASLWLSLVTLEGLQHSWSNAQFIYANAAEDHDQGVIFKHEYDQELNIQKAVNTASLSSAVQQASTRMDARSLTLATAAGALAGGIVGALVTRLLT